MNLLLDMATCPTDLGNDWNNIIILIHLPQASIVFADCCLSCFWFASSQIF
jgi:hypothetical protein